MVFSAFSKISLETFMPNLVFINYPSLQILGKIQTGFFSNLRISSKSLIKENCHNSRTSDGIDMKLGTVTELDKRNKATSKTFYDDAMSSNFDVIVIFPIYGQFRAIQKPDSGPIVCKTYILINSNLLSYKNSK